MYSREREAKMEKQLIEIKAKVEIMIIENDMLKQEIAKLRQERDEAQELAARTFKQLSGV